MRLSGMWMKWRTHDASTSTGLPYTESIASADAPSQIALYAALVIGRISGVAFLAFWICGPPALQRPVPVP